MRGLLLSESGLADDGGRGCCPWVEEDFLSFGVEPCLGMPWRSMASGWAAAAEQD